MLPEQENSRSLIGLMVHPAERQKVEADANGKPLSAYMRERLGLPPAAPQGRRWPEDLSARSWKTKS
jgi:hypothetical protein